MKQLVSKKNLSTFSMVFAAILFSLFCFFAFRNIATVKQLYPGISLRYSEGIEQQKALLAQNYALENANQQPFWPTFWTETQSEFSTDLSKKNALRVVVDGEASLAAPVIFIEGGYPASTATNHCAVSSQLAWLLWGSTDVNGMDVAIEGENYTVCGVFQSKHAYAISGAGVKSPVVWNNVELQGTPVGDARSEAEIFASSSGLGPPPSIVIGSMITAIANFMLFIPISILLMWAVYQIAKRVVKHNPLRREILFFSVLFLFVIILPYFLLKLPGWLIPTKWSDFSHWSNVANSIGEKVREWFLLVPYWKDALAKGVLLKQLFLGFGLFLNGLWLWLHHKPTLKRKRFFFKNRLYKR